MQSNAASIDFKREAGQPIPTGGCAASATQMHTMHSTNKQHRIKPQTHSFYVHEALVSVSICTEVAVVSGVNTQMYSTHTVCEYTNIHTLCVNTQMCEYTNIHTLSVNTQMYTHCV